MVDRTTKLRWRRLLRRKQKQVGEIGFQAENQLEKNLFRRLNRFANVRRFVAAWMLLFVLLMGGLVLQTRGLSRFYQTLEPGQGGVYSEGIYGSFTNANPIYATGPVDTSIARLVFSSLMKYNSNNRLVKDLAASVDVDSTGSEYTIVLRDNVFWHDGTPLTAEDVAFTYKTIQKPDVRSPLFANWKDVEIKTKGQHTVIFTLPHSLASFPHSLTNGIIPKHKLSAIDASNLRSASFNTINPVGSGPFKWEAIEVDGDTPETRQERIGLIANSDYYEGSPNIERFIIRAYHDQQVLENALETKDVTAAAGLSNTTEAIQNSLSIRQYNIPLAAQVMLFMKNGKEPFADKRVRQALALATNKTAIIDSLGYPVAVTDEPLLSSHTGYNAKYRQVTSKQKQAKAVLKKAGWKLNKEGVLQKADKTLTVAITTQDTGEYPEIARLIEQQWEEIGVDVTLDLQTDSSLQTAIAGHNYDVLLYGITVGSDPDVYAYWHSSQADPRSANRLNFAEYKSSTADAALEAGRSRLGEKLRATKYKPFLEAWQADNPAIALYQPRYLYFTQANLYGFEPTIFNSPTDRYANVENWAVRQDRVDIY